MRGSASTSWCGHAPWRRKVRLAQSFLARASGKSRSRKDFRSQETRQRTTGPSSLRIGWSITPLRWESLMATSAWPSATLLNSLPGNNINAWVDFEEGFIRNFTRTYKWLGRPRELALCVQGKDESDR